MHGESKTDIREFLNLIEPISCENASQLLSFDKQMSNSVPILNKLNINLSSEELDIALVGLVGAVAMLIFSNMICCLCCMCKKKDSKRVCKIQIIYH